MDIYQHFRPEERPFIDQVLSWKEEVETFYRVRLTDFLDPREVYIIQSIIGKHSDIQLELFGGHSDVERKRAIIAPYYENIESSLFELCLFEATYQSKFVDITHRDVLGAIMSLGIQRKKIGDIIVSNGLIQIVVCQDIAVYVQMNLNQIKKSTIQLKEELLTQLKVNKENWIEKQSTVSSLRLDNVLKEIYTISRQKAADYINRGAVKVNFRVVENISFIMEEGDIISLQKKGRSKIIKIEGKTKKDKWRIVSAMLK